MSNEHPCLVEKIEELEKKCSGSSGVKINTFIIKKEDFNNVSITGGKKVRECSFGSRDFNAYNHIFRLVQNVYSEDGELISQLPFMLTSYLAMTTGDDQKYTACINIASDAVCVTISQLMWESMASTDKLVLCYI